MGLLLIAALIFGSVLGAASYATPPVFVAAAVVIGVWLLVFAVRERAARGRRQH